MGKIVAFIGSSKNEYPLNMDSIKELCKISRKAVDEVSIYIITDEKIYQLEGSSFIYYFKEDRTIEENILTYDTDLKEYYEEPLYSSVMDHIRREYEKKVA